MVVQRTIDNLKDRPQDERKAVAGGIAIAVVAILFIGWAILFFKKVASGEQQINFDSGAQEEFNFSSVRDAQNSIQTGNARQGEDLRQIRDDSASQQLQGTIELQNMPSQGGTDQFGQPNTY